MLWLYHQVTDMRALLLGLLLLTTSGLQAWAQEKFALLIAQAAYQDTPLATPPADVKLIAGRLNADAFAVTLSIDEKKEVVERKIDDLIAQVNKGHTGLLWFAGHGAQIDGANYLIPIDARINSTKDIQQNTIRLSGVLEKYEAQQGTFIVLLDACRNDPFKGRVEISKRGLAPITDTTKLKVARRDGVFAPGLFVGFSTAENETADDGIINSPFAVAFHNALSGNAGLRLVYVRTRAAVAEATQNKQLPAAFDSIFKDDVLFSSGK